MIFSNNYVIKEISFTNSANINSEIKQNLIGKSIHLINIDQITDSYLMDPHIEKVTIEKIYPNELYIKIDKYSNLALVADLRTNTPIYYKLFKSGDIVKVNFSELYDNDIYGEFVNYFLLLRTTDQSIITNFVLVGDRLTGSIGNLKIDFINPSNLGKKASAVYQRIKEPCPSESLTIDIDELLNEIIVICNI